MRIYKKSTYIAIYGINCRNFAYNSKKERVTGGFFMQEKLIDIVEKFLDFCEEMRRQGKIDDELYMELTKNKIKFLSNI
jgi:hypothetical protein